MIGRIEKSSERDSIGESDVSKASNVTGTPSIWKSTQRQRQATKHIAPIRRQELRIAPKSLHIILSNVYSNLPLVVK